MERLLYYPVAACVSVLQALPLGWVARLGRCGGALAYLLDFRHRRVALRNLTRCFSNEKTDYEIRAIAREHFRRLGENYSCAIRTAAMTWAELKSHVQFVNTETLPVPGEAGASPNCIVAIGHFGNFELYARFGEAAPGYKCATTYRALRQPSLNRLLQRLRGHSPCLFFERRTEAEALKKVLSGGRILLGLLADQHAGQRGVAVPFFGHRCSTTPAPAILALRYNCTLFTGICYRVGLAQWRIEADAQVATHELGQPRSVEAITADINRIFEKAVRRDPANWFWVHNRWKPFRSRAGQAPLGTPPAPARADHASVPRSGDP